MLEEAAKGIGYPAHPQTLTPQPNAPREIRPAVDREDQHRRREVIRTNSDGLDGVSASGLTDLEQYWLNVVRDHRIGARCIDPPPDTEARRRRWIALSIRKHYDLDWVPEELAAHIVAFAWHQDEHAWILTLRSGARVVDRFDRIDLVGMADDIAIAELVRCVQRRGWQAVKLYGNVEFRMEAARALVAADIRVIDPSRAAPHERDDPPPAGTKPPGS